MISARSVTFTYPGRLSPALRGIDLRIEPGASLLLTGPTGCGKSTFLKTINGLIPHSTMGILQGEVFVAGQSVASLSLHEHCRRVGSVYQNPRDQILHTWVEDEVAFALQNLGYDRAAIHKRIDEALEWVGLPGFRNRTIHELSGGQLQRVVLAAVCAPLPKALLLDEPVSQLDPAGTLSVLSTIHQLRLQRSLTTVFVDHRIEAAMPFTDRVSVLAGGAQVEDVSWDGIWRDPSVLSKYGIEISDLMEAARRLGRREQVRQPDDLAEWVKANWEWRIQSGLNQKNVKNLLASPNLWGRDSTAPPERSSEEVVICNEVDYRYSKRGAHALDGVSLTLHRGESIAVIGENGSGKTTLLMMLAGVYSPQEGSMDRPSPPKAQEFMGAIVPQNPDLLLQADTVAEEIGFGLRCRGAPEGVVRRCVSSALESFHLTEVAEDPPFALSQGQRQRVAMAAAFAVSPRILLLDEPTTGQDRRHIDLCMSALRERYVAQGGCMVFCTHDLRTVAEYADRVIVLKAGRMIADGPVLEVLSCAEVLRSAGHFLPPLVRVSHLLGGPPTVTVDQFLEVYGMS